MITIPQCRSARGLLGWTQQDLADACGLSKTAINNFEKGHSEIKAESLQAIRKAFESADIEFLDRTGLRQKTETLRLLKGLTALDQLYQNIAETLERTGGDLLVHLTHGALMERLSPEAALRHRRVLDQRGLHQRILCPASIMPPQADPRDLTRVLPDSTQGLGPSVFLYGTQLALALWQDTTIVLMNAQDAVQAERARFEMLWKNAEPAKDASRKSKS